MAVRPGTGGEAALVRGRGAGGAGSGGPCKILVCGGAVVDCIVRPFDPAQRGASHTSLPGEARVSLGGVGRNIAEAIARLGGEPHLLSVVGDDEPGRQLGEACRSIGVGVDALLRSRRGRTATYTALLDGSGELVGAVADMGVFDEVGAAAVRAAVDGLRGVGLIVCDANLQAPALEQALASGEEAAVPVWFEPVSTAKALRGRCARPWHLISPNWDELLALVGRPSREGRGGDSEGTSAAGDPDWQPPVELVGALHEALEQRLAEHVLVTVGPGGALLASAPGHGGGALPPTAVGQGGQEMAATSTPKSAAWVIDAARLLAGLADAPAGVPPLRLRVESLERPPQRAGGGGRVLWFRLLEPAASVRDVTGAGDALLAGAARAFSGGWPLEEAMVAGLFFAHLTLFVNGAVAECLSAELFRRLGRAVVGASRL